MFVVADLPTTLTEFTVLPVTFTAVLSFAVTLPTVFTVTSSVFLIVPTSPVMLKVPVPSRKTLSPFETTVFFPVKNSLFVPPDILIVGSVPVMNAVAPAFMLNAGVAIVTPDRVPNSSTLVPET